MFQLKRAIKAVQLLLDQFLKRMCQTSFFFKYKCNTRWVSVLSLVFSKDLFSRFLPSTNFPFAAMLPFRFLQQIEPSTLSISENGRSHRIMFESTVPITCRPGDLSCAVRIPLTAVSDGESKQRGECIQIRQPCVT